MIGFDDTRVHWVTAFLGHAGHPLLTSRDFINREAGAHDVRLVVIDPNGLTHEKLAKLLAFLRPQPLTVCILDIGDGVGRPRYPREVPASALRLLPHGHRQPARVDRHGLTAWACVPARRMPS